MPKRFLPFGRNNDRGGLYLVSLVVGYILYPTRTYQHQKRIHTQRFLLPWLLIYLPLALGLELTMQNLSAFEVRC